MPWIRFTRAYRVQPFGPSYEEGQQVEVGPRSVAHFISRGAAVEVTKPSPPVVDEQSLDDGDGRGVAVSTRRPPVRMKSRGSRR